MERALELYRRVVDGGEAVIDEFIQTRTVEELFLDFKRSANDGGSAVLHQNDRNSLAKAISGFGNSSGGIIVWGVDCSRDLDGADVAKAKHPIGNVTRFLANLQSSVSGCTIPPHNKVEHREIRLNDGTGYVVSYIPESENMPHQVVGKLQYLIRAGSDFVPVPHQVLAGMFGKRPQPHVFPMFTMNPARSEGHALIFEYGIMLTNGGPGLARDVYFSSMIHYGLGSNTQISWEFHERENWTGDFVLGRQVSVVSKRDFLIPPKAFFTPLSLHIVMSPPITEPLLIKGILGCSEALATEIEFNASADEASRIYDKYFAQLAAGEVNEEFRQNLASQLLNVPGNE
ncbi:MAG: ATP-binding protein [Nitrospirales bacterium]